MQFVLRGVRDSRELTDNLRLAVAAVDKEQSLCNVRTMEEQRREEMCGIRSAAIMIGTYEAIALLLAIPGIYSVNSFAITQRTMRWVCV